MKENKTSWLTEHAGDILSYGGLALCILLFTILSKVNGNDFWSAYNLKKLIEQVCVYAILTVGAVFIYSMGAMDISVGAQIGVYCIILILTANATGSLLVGFLAVLALALLCGFFNGYVSVLLGLPSIVTSIFLMSIFSGVQMLMMEQIGSNTVKLISELKAIRNVFKDTTVMLAAIVMISLIAAYLYYFTALGRNVKSIGANEQATVASGVNTVRWKVLAYAFFGVCVAIAAFFLTCRVGSAGKGTGDGYAMDIMVALLLGGMPLSGGMKSKLSSSLVGAFTYVILSNGLILSGVDTKQVYVIKALVFLAVILVTCRKKDGVLPR